jgi:hypothetical protein
MARIQGWQNPIAAFPSADAGLDQVVFDEVILDGSGSEDPDGTIESYEWLLRCRQDTSCDREAQGVSPIVSDLKPGFYDVTLRVTDNDGLTDSATMILAVAGRCEPINPGGECLTYYLDADGDGYGNPDVSQIDTNPPLGHVANADDCDDTNDSINPSATEVCDETDNNCNGQIDEECSLNVTHHSIYYIDLQLGSTLSFEYRWEMGTGPSDFIPPMMYDILAVMAFFNSDWIYIGQIGAYRSSTTWESKSLTIPEELRGIETQIMFDLTDYDPITDPRVYLRNIH